MSRVERDPERGRAVAARLDAPANVTPWDGQDRILTRSRGAAAPWHGVLCDHLVRHEGRSLEDLAGRVGWLYLRLTWQEVEDLIGSAKAKKLEPTACRPALCDGCRRSGRRLAEGLAISHEISREAVGCCFCCS
jgi:hypothetical protein